MARQVRRPADAVDRRRHTVQRRHQPDDQVDLLAVIQRVDRVAGDLEAAIDRDFGKAGLQKTLALLDEGRAVLVFPEGERTHDGELEPFKAGISLLVKKVKAPIVPVGIAGAFDAWPRGRNRPRFAPLFRRSISSTCSFPFGCRTSRRVKRAKLGCHSWRASTFSQKTRS